ncbi:hypothetical protein ACJJTC_009680 [Scirpophaga incertulas]
MLITITDNAERKHDAAITCGGSGRAEQTRRRAYRQADTRREQRASVPSRSCTRCQHGCERYRRRPQDTCKSKSADVESKRNSTVSIRRPLPTFFLAFAFSPVRAEISWDRNP